MRLRSSASVLTAAPWPGSPYGGPRIVEQHHHRYEYDDGYREHLQNASLRGLRHLPQRPELVEIIEDP